MSNDVTLSEKVYSELYNDITHQRLKSGQNVTLDMLKKRFNVSHTPIREALTRLSSDGLLTYQPNKGMKVAQFSNEEIKELFEFTAELEAMAIGFCQGSFTLAPMLSELDEIINTESKALEDDNLELWDSVAGNIHDVFYKYSENRYLNEAASRMAARMEVMSNIYSTPDTYPEIHKRHVGIVEAIKSGDFDKAKNLVRAHLQFSMIQTLEDYSKQQGGGSNGQR